MVSLLTTITALFITAVSCQSQPYGSGSGSGSSGQGAGGSGPVIMSCPTQFAITSFTASCTRRGIGCQFSFNVATNESLSSPVTCTASFPDIAVELPLVPYTPCTEDRSIVWGWAPVGQANASATGYSMIITDARLGLAAAKLWDASAFPMTTSGAAVYQNFTGEPGFDI